MNILLINHYAGSLQHGMEFRPAYLAREWAKQGHQVTIVAASFSHLRSHNPCLLSSVLEEWIQGVRYLWLQTPTYPQNGLWRALNIFAFVGQLLRFKRLLARCCTRGVVIASSTYPLDIFPANIVAKAARARLVYEVHDLWPLTPIEIGGMSPTHPFIRLLQWAEDFAYRRSDAVVSLLPAAEGHMREHGLLPGRFIPIPNGVVVADWEDSSSEDIPQLHYQTIARFRQERRCLIGYAGSHGTANCLHTLVEAASLLRDTSIRIILVGEGPEKANLEADAQRRGLTNLVFLPAVPKKTIPTLLRQMDALTLCFSRLPLYRFGVSPNKLIDYMMAGRPIVLAMNAGNDPVIEAGCGISVDAEDPSALRAALERISAITPNERCRLGGLGRVYALENHDFAKLADRLLREVERVSRSAHPAWPGFPPGDIKSAVKSSEEY